MMKYLFTAILLFGLCILNPASASAEKPLLFSAGAGAMSGTIDIAIEKGFIEDQQAQILRYKNGSESLNAFLDGQVDIGITSSNNVVVSNKFDPKKHAIVATLSYTDNQLKLLTRNASGIRQISDLKGKTVALRSFFNQYILSKWLNNYGIASSEVTFIKKSKNQIPAAIASGQVDAMFQHGKPIEEAKKLLGENGWMIFQNANIERKQDLLLMNRDMITKNPELVKKVLNAVLTAQNYLKKNPSECISIVAKAKEYTLPQMEEAMNEITYSLTLKQSLLLEMETLDTWLIENNFIPKRKSRNYLDYIDLQPLLNVNPNAVTMIH